MFTKTSGQTSIFNIENYFPNALPRSDWSYTYQEHILPQIDEEKFRHLFSDSSVGRPNTSIRTLVSILIFMGWEKITFRDAEFLFSRRIDWLNATRTAPGSAKIDHTTIFYFLQRLESDETARKLFVSLTDNFIKACRTSLRMQRTDSFFIHGWLRTLTRYGLFKETIRKFLQTLRKQKENLYEKIAGELSQNYLEKEFDLTEKDNELAQKKVALMAKDLYRLKSAFENHHKVKEYDTFKILKQVFTQQCEIKENQSASPEIILKDKPDSDTINTPHNPEARYVRKGKQRCTGDKAFVTETCAPENKTQFFTDAELTAATVHDSTQQPQIQERLIENQMKPEQQFEDAGFVTGQNILDSNANQIELEGPTAGRSQSFEDYAAKDRPFDAGDFETTYHEESNQLTVQKCPNGQVPLQQNRSEKTGEMLVHFDPQVCATCEHAERCSVKIGKRVATYTVNEAEYVGAVRHHQYMSDSTYRKECAIRAGVEASVSELTRSHGVRRARHRKRKRTRVRLIFAVLACNVKRFIRHGEQYGYESPIIALSV